jgi:hypothetical protein
MTSELPEADRVRLPPPFRDRSFVQLRQGVFDDPAIDVFVDDKGSFACLTPQPQVDYFDYRPRKKLPGLGQYKKDGSFVRRRFEFIADWFGEDGVVVEIGSSDGAFLSVVRDERPRLTLYAIEPDAGTRERRQQVAIDGAFCSIEEARSARIKAQIVCFFHVFEHVLDPVAFLTEIGALLERGGRIIIEVPSLDDPLLSVYKCAAYEAFYFQRQHPFVYSGRALADVLQAAGWRVTATRFYQRYGLENHLGWLANGRPGGDARFAALFAGIDVQYRASLEAAGSADTVFVMAEPA